MNHPNIVPFRGVALNPPQPVSDWMGSGNIREFLREHPDANRLGLVRPSPYSQSGGSSSIRQLCDVAEGLNYIHSRNVVHGAIKGVRTLELADNLAEIAQSNLLVDYLGRARVTDFILAAVNQNQCSTCGVAKAHSLNTRWSAPEVSEFSSEIGPLTDKADVFSFAMVIIEVSRGTCCATIFV